MTATIAWDREKLRSLIQQRDAAVSRGHSSFVWEYRESRFSSRVERHEFDVRYAKYLIGELRKTFDHHPDQPAMPNREGGEDYDG
jgi:hypothetical protein